MEDFKQTRETLLDMLEGLDDRLAKITDDIKHVDEPISQDFAEQAVETENDQVLDSLGNSARDEIEKIKLAISRIDGGTFGICLSCGQPIKKERLQAIPFSSQCIHCAEKKDDD